MKNDLEEIRACEGLSQEGVMEHLVQMYQGFPPGYPGGHTRLQHDYRRHVHTLGRELESGEIGLDHYLTDGFPNTFMWQKGVKDPASLRRNYRMYAIERLEPVDAAYYHAFLDHMHKNVPELQGNAGPVEVPMTLEAALFAVSLRENTPEVRVADLCDWVGQHVMSNHPSYEDALGKVRTLG